MLRSSPLIWYTICHIPLNIGLQGQPLTWKTWKSSNCITLKQVPLVNREPSSSKYFGLTDILKFEAEVFRILERSQEQHLTIQADSNQSNTQNWIHTPTADFSRILKIHWALFPFNTFERSWSYPSIGSGIIQYFNVHLRIQISND